LNLLLLSFVAHIALANPSGVVYHVYLSGHAANTAYRNFEENISAIAVQRFGETFRDREGSNVAFEERSFGDIVKPGDITYPTSSNYAVDLSSLVISLALFDGDCATILFNFPKLHLVITCHLNHNIVQEIRCYLHARAYLYHMEELDKA
jgi:hypothetical protein